MFYIQSLVDRIIKKPEKNVLGMSKKKKKWLVVQAISFYTSITTSSFKLVSLHPWAPLNNSI